MESKNAKRPDFPLRSVLTERSLFVLDNRGNIAKKISLKGYSETTLSDDGMTMAGLKGNEIILSDLNNEVQGTVKIGDPQPVVLSQHVKFELSPDGEFIVVLSSFSHTIYFHDRNGKLLSKEKVADLKGAEIKFSDDSKYVTIHVPNWGKGKTNGYLLFFDDKGKKLWRFDHKGCQASFDVSGDGNAVVIAAEGRVYSLDGMGEIVYEEEVVAGVVIVSVSPDGGYIVVAQRYDGHMTLIDISEDEKRWSKKIEDFDTMRSSFSSLEVADQGKWVGVVIEKNLAENSFESYLCLFNKKGDLKWKNSFDKNRVDNDTSFYLSLVLGMNEAFLFRNF